MHALIIEDESLIAFAIEDILRECGFDSIDLAASPASAIAAAEKHCPDLITSDVELRPGCGISTVIGICDRSSIPVIFITGNVDQVTRRLPSHPALNKPFSESSLRAAVANAMA